MSYTSQSLRLFLVSNLSVLNLRIFLLMYSESLTQTERHRDPVASRPPLLCYSANLWPLLLCYAATLRPLLLYACDQSYSGCCVYATLLLCGQCYSVATATLNIDTLRPVLLCGRCFYATLLLCGQSYSVVTATLLHCYSAANATLWSLLLCYTRT